MADLGRSTAFYRDELGFTTRENLVESGAARIELVAGDSAVDGTGERQPRDAAKDPAGQLLRRFRVLDLEGNRFTFGQPFE